MVKEGRRIHFFSRRGNDLQRRLGSFAEYFAGLAATSATIDGEITVAAGDGRPDFSTGDRWQGHPSRAAGAARELLADLLDRSGIGCVCFSEAFGDGPALLKACAGLGLEGIVSKRRDAPYRAGKRPEWVKVKTAEWREANQERPEAFSAAVERRTGC